MVCHLKESNYQVPFKIAAGSGRSVLKEMRYPGEDIKYYLDVSIHFGSEPRGSREVLANSLPTEFSIQISKNNYLNLLKQCKEVGASNFKSNWDSKEGPELIVSGQLELKVMPEK
jgi:hypothetical protein